MRPFSESLEPLEPDTEMEEPVLSLKRKSPASPPVLMCTKRLKASDKDSWLNFLFIARYFSIILQPILRPNRNQKKISSRQTQTGW